MLNILGKEISSISEELLNILLKDRTTKKNICWASDLYISYGYSYYPQEPITIDLIIDNNIQIIRPRNAKLEFEQLKRTKNKAEVFTPSWVCNIQNNLVDEAWFGRKNVFNTASINSWITIKEKIYFPYNKTWQSYVDSKRLEISCGEAPYLVSRYDTVTGKKIPIEDRVGILDRKIRVINENTNEEKEWYKWIIRAYESTYGYEYQGDNILIARENLLYTFIENMHHKFSHYPSNEQLKKIARIISWNIWQMEGITMTVPYSEKTHVTVQTSLFDFLDEIPQIEKKPLPCRIFDWRSNNSLEFRNMLKKGE